VREARRQPLSRRRGEVWRGVETWRHAEQATLEARKLEKVSR
jgi:hypothetical protein